MEREPKGAERTSGRRESSEDASADGPSRSAAARFEARRAPSPTGHRFGTPRDRAALGAPGARAGQRSGRGARRTFLVRRVSHLARLATRRPLQGREERAAGRPLTPPHTPPTGPDDLGGHS